MATRLAWLIVLIHALVSGVHGFAHYRLGITLSTFQSVYVMLVITVWPLWAAGLLWIGKTRAAFVNLALAMGGAFVFGVYWHYVARSPDNVFHQHEGSLQTLFCVTAALLMVLESCGAMVSGWGFLGRRSG